MTTFSLKLLKSKNPFKDAVRFVSKIDKKVANAEEAVNGLFGLKNFAIESLLGPKLVNVLRLNRDSVKALIDGIIQLPESTKQQLIAFFNSEQSKKFELKLETKSLSAKLDKYRNVWRNLVLGESVSGILLAIIISLIQVFLLIALYIKVPPKTFVSLCLALTMLGIIVTIFYVSLITSSSLIGSTCEDFKNKQQIKECMNTDNVLNLLKFFDYGICGKYDAFECNLPTSLRIRQDQKALKIILPNALESTLNGTKEFVKSILQPQLKQFEIASKEFQPLLEKSKSFSALLPFDANLLDEAFSNLKTLKTIIGEKVRELTDGNLRNALECRQLGKEAYDLMENVCKSTLRTFDELHSITFLLMIFLIFQIGLILLAVWIASRGQRQRFPSNLFTSFFD